MAKRNRRHQRKPKPQRHFRVWGERRDPPDMRKLGQALLSLAQADIERQAQAEHEATPPSDDQPQDRPEETADD